MKVGYRTLGASLQVAMHCSFQHSVIGPGLDGGMCSSCSSSFCACWKVHMSIKLCINVWLIFAGSELRKLEMLYELNVSANQLSCLPAAVSQLPKLVVLRAHSNFLRNLPDFRQTKSLRVWWKSSDWASLEFVMTRNSVCVGGAGIPAPKSHIMARAAANYWLWRHSVMVCSDWAINSLCCMMLVVVARKVLWSYTYSSKIGQISKKVIDHELKACCTLC